MFESVFAHTPALPKPRTETEAETTAEQLCRFECMTRTPSSPTLFLSATRMPHARDTKCQFDISHTPQWVNFDVGWRRTSVEHKLTRTKINSNLQIGLNATPVVCEFVWNSAHWTPWMRNERVVREIWNLSQQSIYYSTGSRLCVVWKAAGHVMEIWLKFLLNRIRIV